MIIKAADVKNRPASLWSVVLHAYLKELYKRADPKLSKDAPKGFIHVSGVQLEADLGLDKVAQAKWLQELKLTGAILVERHGAGGPKRYINPFPNGKE